MRSRGYERAFPTNFPHKEVYVSEAYGHDVTVGNLLADSMFRDSVETAAGTWNLPINAILWDEAIFIPPYKERLQTVMSWAEQCTYECNSVPRILLPITGEASRNAIVSQLRDEEKKAVGLTMSLQLSKQNIVEQESLRKLIGEITTTFEKMFEEQRKVNEDQKKRMRDRRKQLETTINEQAKQLENLFEVLKICLRILVEKRRQLLIDATGLTKGPLESTGCFYVRIGQHLQGSNDGSLFMKLSNEFSKFSGSAQMSGSQREAEPEYTWRKGKPKRGFEEEDR
ncbi:hypothetical protein BDR26DRAFT_854053 [Obelidium mucronatum]|nr:hypothetical protein BDR26DRAFT_854053 [Obelidium mucronatum]